jgi:EmrB/QacA subfamily drug resistance transporter
LNWTGWTITAYGLGFVIALPIAGRLSDQFGRRRVLVCGVAIFTAASLMCGLSTSIYELIVFRVLQAIGGGALTPAAAGLIAEHFGANRDRAIGMFGTITAGGQVAGPVIGGVIVGYLSWRWIFFVNLPIGALLIYLPLRYIPESRLVRGQKLDIAGLLLLSGWVLAAILGITNLGSGHTELVDPVVLGPLVCAAVLLVLFLRHAQRAANPFIPMRFIRGRGFAAVNSVNFLFGAVTFGIASLVPLYAEERYHLPPLNAGTLLAARAIGIIAVGALAAFSLRRTGYRLPMTVGYGLVALGTLLISFGPPGGITAYAWLTIGAAITGLGNGVSNPASRNACLQLAPDDVAAITGLRQMFAQLGLIFYVSISTALLNRSPHPATTQVHIWWVMVIVIVTVMLPLVWRIPEHKGSW